MYMYYSWAYEIGYEFVPGDTLTDPNASVEACNGLIQEI